MKILNFEYLIILLPLLTIFLSLLIYISKKLKKQSKNIVNNVNIEYVI